MKRHQTTWKRRRNDHASPVPTHSPMATPINHHSSNNDHEERHNSMFSSCSSTSSLDPDHDNLNDNDDAGDDDDDDEYDGSFEGILDSPHLRSLFTQYLQSIHNLEPLHFLEETERFASKKSSKNRYQLAGHIIDEYIRERSPREINLSRLIRQRVLKQFEGQCSEEHCPRDLFDSVMATVAVELKEDSFFKFLSSPLFLSHYCASTTTTESSTTTTTMTTTTTTTTNSDESVVVGRARSLTCVVSRSSGSGSGSFNSLGSVGSVGHGVNSGGNSSPRQQRRKSMLMDDIRRRSSSATNSALMGGGGGGGDPHSPLESAMSRSSSDHDFGSGSGSSGTSSHHHHHHHNRSGAGGDDTVDDREMFSGMNRSDHRITKEEVQYALREIMDYDESSWIPVPQKSKYDGRALYYSRKTYAFDDASSSGNGNGSDSSSCSSDSSSVNDNGGSSSNTKKYKYLRKMKEEGYLPCGIDEAFYLVSDVDFMNVWESELRDVEHLSSTPPTGVDNDDDNGDGTTDNNGTRDSCSFATTLFSTEYYCTFPIKNREFIFRAAAIRLDPDRILYIRKGMNTPDLPPVKKGCVRAESIGALLLQRIYRDKTKFVNFALIDFGGQIPVKLWNYGMATRDDRYNAGLYRALEKRRKRYEKSRGSESNPPKDSLGLCETLVLNDTVMKKMGTIDY